MKKRNLNSLKLNKKSVSSFQSNFALFGGRAIISCCDNWTKCPNKGYLEKTKKEENS